jgi:hypothetical protein
MKDAVPQDDAPNRDLSALGILLIIILTVGALAEVLVGASRLWHPLGSLGYRADWDYKVYYLDPGSPAEAAGMRRGDRIDVRAMTPSDRRDASNGAVSKPGNALTLHLRTQGHERTVTLIAQAERLSPLSRAVIGAREVVALGFITIGVLLVLRRQSRTTWGFYLYCMGLNPGGSIGWAVLPPVTWYVGASVVNATLHNLGYIGGLVFALNFPREPRGGWRERAQSVAPLLFVVLSAVSLLAIAMRAWGSSTELLSRSEWALQVAINVVALYALLESYLVIRGPDRRRVQWVFLAFAIAFVSAILAFELNNSSWLPLSVPYPFISALFLLTGVVPIAVVYAIVRHHVFDVNFVISRALVYGVITSILVTVFSLLHWFISKQLAQTQLAFAAEIVAALALGFWLNGLHRNVDRLVDSAFFRQRHRAEQRLARAAAAIPHAESYEAVNHFLVDEPIHALDLASAALFHGAADGRFVREAAAGCDETYGDELRRNDPLVLHMLAERAPLRLSEVGVVSAGRSGAVLASPVVVRQRLAAIVLYGAHRDGADIDPDEVRSLVPLCVSAGAAYAHIEAETLRLRNETLEHENDALRAASKPRRRRTRDGAAKPTV